jgi:hypothetical protein
MQLYIIFKINLSDLKTHEKIASAFLRFSLEGGLIVLQTTIAKT